MNPHIPYAPLPAIGKRSPINRAYVRTLKKSYYVANLCLLIGITAVFGWIRYRQWLADRNTVLIPDNHIQIIDITKFTPPPLDPQNDGSNPIDLPIQSTGPVLGIPKPVPDAMAVNQTMPDQGSITGQNVLPGTVNVNDTNSVRIQSGNEIPEIGQFVAVEVPARVLSAVPPAYPATAKVLGQQGTVFIHLLVDKDGSVMRVSVAKTSGYPLLDSAAVQCGHEWKFSAAVQNHKPVRIWISAPVRFVLN